MISTLLSVWLRSAWLGGRWRTSDRPTSFFRRMFPGLWLGFEEESICSIWKNMFAHARGLCYLLSRAGMYVEVYVLLAGLIVLPGRYASSWSLGSKLISDIISCSVRASNLTSGILLLLRLHCFFLMATVLRALVLHSFVLARLKHCLFSSTYPATCILLRYDLWCSAPLTLMKYVFNGVPTLL